MTTPAWTKSVSVRIALAVLLVSIVVTGWSVSQALRVEALPDVPPTTLASLESIKTTSAAPAMDVQAAVENDLFSADRTAPAAPYRMPGEHAPEDKPVVEPMKPIVLGTVVATDGRSFATVQLGDARPTLVHVGDKIGEWAVKAIVRGKVTLVSTSGTRIDVTVPKPGM
jgi:hypothetical protein